MTQNKNADAKLASDFKNFEQTQKDLAVMLKEGRVDDALAVVEQMPVADVRKIGKELRAGLIEGLKAAKKDTARAEEQMGEPLAGNATATSPYDSAIARLTKITPETEIKGPLLKGLVFYPGKTEIQPTYVANTLASNPQTASNKR